MCDPSSRNCPYLQGRTGQLTDLTKEIIRVPRVGPRSRTRKRGKSVTEAFHEANFGWLMGFLGACINPIIPNP